MIVYSEKMMQIIMLELTVSWEENMEEADERKFGKYWHIAEECKSRFGEHCANQLKYDAEASMAGNLTRLP